jgi:hypothetical protein
MKGSWMRAEWEPDELIDAWTLVEGDWEIVGEGRSNQARFLGDLEVLRDRVEAIFAAPLRSAPDGPVTAQPGTEGRDVGGERDRVVEAGWPLEQDLQDRP